MNIFHTLFISIILSSPQQVTYDFNSARNLIYSVSYSEDIESSFYTGKNTCTLIEYMIDSKTTKNIYQSTYSIDRVSWSANKNHIAFITSWTEKINPDRDSIKPNLITRKKLVILDSNYKLVKEIIGAQKYCWSPSAEKIVVIVGSEITEGLEFMPKKTFIYDLINENETPITDIATDVFWAKHNNMIYLDSDSIKSFDPEKCILAKTEFSGIYFSFDGRYYYCPSIEGTQFSLRKSDTNQIVDTHPILKEYILQPTGWLESSNTLLVFDPSKKVNILINIENGKSVEIESDRLPGIGKYISPYLFQGLKVKPIMDTLQTIR